MKALYLIITTLFLVSCNKSGDNPAPATSANTTQFVKYFIGKGKHYANDDSTTLVIVNTNEQKFAVKFDSSAIYQTVLLSNQADINKLYGFSDNQAFHQQFSARFGWNWLNNGLHLWAYDYNNSNREYKDLGAVAIGKEIICSIKVAGDTYVFAVDGKETVMPRAATTATGYGYKLFPYFGGDETAPHDITIFIKEL